MYDLTIIIPLSRHLNVPLVAEQLSKQQHSLNIKVLLLVDNLHITPTHINNHFDCFDYQAEWTGKRPAGEANIGQRRQHIVDVLNFGRQQTINSPYIMILEDDTILNPDTIQNLYNQRHDGITSAIQAGRHYYKIVGAWNITPETYTSIPYQPTDTCDATGLYCLIQPTRQYLETPLRHHPDLPVGPDVTYTRNFDIRLAWEEQAGHQTHNGIIYPGKDCVSITFKQQGDRWRLAEL